MLHFTFLTHPTGHKGPIPVQKGERWKGSGGGEKKIRIPVLQSSHGRRVERTVGKDQERGER